MRRPRRRRTKLDFRIALALVVAAGGAFGATFQWPAAVPGGRPGATATEIEIDGAGATISRRFGACHSGGGTNCVVDGDTFWLDGERIRIADIDAPETHPPRCAEEARLGDAATERLRALLNAGPVQLAMTDRDTDRYGRKLRVVLRDGRSLGAQMVDEGLARTWTGHRRPWC
ncbi:endonuclease YncB(thermonuclease family) [Sphingomonas naasensis]|uniref:thermonuclease family protein n=1 Tax=Sphingomonas naasensis TaxID=1344951 RepID=UPI001F112509|nr:thermonuclease family protein [Sphingomonas naasensis]NIJ21986.1 endonuclease YncB(thermonuclease family) [Sphingomonas naasensis]